MNGMNMRPRKQRNSGDMKIHTLKRFRYTVFSTCDHGMSVNGLSRYIGLLRKMLRLGWSDIIRVGGRGLDRRRGIGRHMCVGVYRSGRPYSNGCIMLRSRRGGGGLFMGYRWDGETASQAARDAYEALYDAQNEVACLMLGSMSPELQRTLENYKAYDMIPQQTQNTMFEEQAKQELFEIVKAFHACKQDDGQSVSSYLLKDSYLRNTLERLGYAMPNELGLRGSRKLKHGALSLYMGNGMRACVEAIRSFDLILPSGLIIKVGFVLVLGASTNTVASKGGERRMFAKYDEEEYSDDVNYDDDIVNEETRIGFVKSDDDDVSQKDNKVQKWKDVEKDDTSIFDDLILIMLERKDVKILELESTLTSVDNETEFEDHLKKLIQVEVEYIVISTKKT
ncbi:hypothetical protein Tco_0829813 [Tanacetum coccineum]